MTCRIAVDGRFINRTGGGVSYYTRELVRVLGLCPDIDLYVLANSDTPDTGHPVLPAPYGVQRHGWADVWYSWILPRQLQARGIDVFHSPAFRVPLSGRVKRTVTIHDLTPFIVPDTMPARFRRYLKLSIRHSLRCADMVLVDSHTVKQEIIERFGPGCGKRLFVWPPRLTAPVAAFPAPERREAMVLTMGGHARKNIPLLVRAFARFKQRFPAYRLVVLGRGDDCPASPGVEYTGYVTEAQKLVYLRTAEMFIFPSSYEGFGIPIHEAFASGCPVVAADIPVLRETAGQGAVFFRPGSDGDLCAAMVTLSQDKALRSGLARAGAEQLDRFQEQHEPQALWRTFCAL